MDRPQMETDVQYNYVSRLLIAHQVVKHPIAIQ